jgi:hypothetical protein
LVLRSRIADLGLAPLRRVPNAAAVLFLGAEPTATTEASL